MIVICILTAAFMYCAPNPAKRGCAHHVAGLNTVCRYRCPERRAGYTDMKEGVIYAIQNHRK